MLVVDTQLALLVADTASDCSECTHSGASGTAVSWLPERAAAVSVGMKLDYMQQCSRLCWAVAYCTSELPSVHIQASREWSLY